MSETGTAARTAVTEPPATKAATRGRRGRPVGDREAQRTKLLRAGIKVIADEGYAGASLRKVAKQAGHTTGAITYYFADKEEMVGAIIEFMFDGFDAMLDSGDEVADHRKRLKRWVELNSNSDGWTIMLPIEIERFAPERVDALINAIIKLLQPPAAARKG